MSSYCSCHLYRQYFTMKWVKFFRWLFSYRLFGHFFSHDLNKWTSFSGFLGQRLNNLQPGYTFEIILRHCFNMTKFLPNLVNSRKWLFSMNNNYIWAHVYGWNIEDIFYLIPQNTFTFKNVGWNFFGNNLVIIWLTSHAMWGMVFNYCVH